MPLRRPFLASLDPTLNADSLLRKALDNAVTVRQSLRDAFWVA
jgi:hypothetical protein